jgi:hypothetical protein
LLFWPFCGAKQRHKRQKSRKGEIPELDNPPYWRFHAKNLSGEDSGKADI